MTRALIVGSEGQDGRLLFDYLAGRGDVVLGLGRGTARAHPPPAGVSPAGTAAVPLDVLDPAAVDTTVAAFRPDEVYYLAAVHHSAEDRDAGDPPSLYRRSHDLHVSGLLNVLDALRRLAPRAKLFYAASSHVFGHAPGPTQDEQTPFRPRCVYGITKTAGAHSCRLYRQSHGVFASVGILYNHESPLRRPPFLSRKIVRAAVAIRRGRQKELVVGDLSAEVDWGYAPDYVEAMARILALDTADDFVIATGTPHAVRDFAAAAFSALGMDWAAHVRVDGSILVKSNPPLVGDASKLRRLTGWRPSVTFEQMVARLVRAEETTPP